MDTATGLILIILIGPILAVFGPSIWLGLKDAFRKLGD